MTTRPGGDVPLAPTRRSRSTPAAPVAEFDDADVVRGQAAAVLGALGRMQLKLDVLAREQSEALARLEARLESIERAVAQTEPAGGDS
jgi:hypothetical protein